MSMIFMFRTTRKMAFTLAEVLIALALLGVVAAFVIPKILQGVGEQQRISQFKEVIATIAEVQQKGMPNNELVVGNLSTYFSSQLNALKVCPTDSTVAPVCWDTARQGTPIGNEHTESGFVMPNGVVITGLNNCCTSATPGWSGNGTGNGFLVDYNGLAGPNRVGEDQLFLDMCFSPNVDCVHSGVTIQRGSIQVFNSLPEPEDTANKALFRKIVSQ